MSTKKDKKSEEKASEPVLTRLSGCPMRHPTKSLTCGPNGPVCLHDVDLLEKILEFDREKIPSRNVHALGCGVYGKFTVTNDEIAKYSIAKLFSDVGKETEIFVRFSGIFTEQGDADTSRDPRGFAIKFYTEEGNWDLLGISTPVFIVRDAKVGPDAIHANKRDPRNFMWNKAQRWDFVANHPESLHQMMMVYTDRGTPMSYRRMHGYGCHTFSFISPEGKRYWVKFHIICDKKVSGLNREDAMKLAGVDPNFLSRDLWNAIENKDFPTWKLKCQIMEEEEGWDNPSLAFDPTKCWKKADYPLIDIGDIELNRNPIDYHTEVEESAFSPANFVPGIGLSADKLLQGRLLIYEDTQRHRIGAHFKQLPVNQPKKSDCYTNYIGGPMQMITDDKKNKFPHYYPSSFGNPKIKELDEPLFRSNGPSDYYDFPDEGSDKDYYEQPADFWEVLDKEAQCNLCSNIASDFRQIEEEEIISKCLKHFRKISEDFADCVEKSIREDKNDLENLSEKINSELE